MTALVAQPALMLRLVGLVLRLPRLALPLAFAGFVGSLVAFYGTNRSAPATLLLVGFFALTEFFAAFLLISEPEGPPRHAHRDRATFGVEVARGPE